ncbi:Lipid-droplet associated hydrolase [Teratosphaeria destructans]|uniref:Lipid-droplet associated hydrolase n=1 Tax=Teratosphaeria destructans TaxID=418781 RepID=A0A9W7SLN1_9PEZI|nr:Lipid-droplet associated hydrolase [Teratosphaeria destructans]
MPSNLQDEIQIQSYASARDDDLGSRKTILVFMITGNPGLIEYYRHFLYILNARLNNSSKPRRTVARIYGASLSGFEVSGPAPRDGPLNLHQQIERVTARLVRAARSTADSDAQDLPIVLVGHSVGSYILLEILHRLQTSQNGLELNIVGGICLFPTIVDIAQSPTGRKLTPLLLLPGFAFAIHTLSKLLFFLLPMSLMIPLVQLLTRMPRRSAATTAAFLKSPGGVRQALHMAKYEMLEIAADDRWSDELWGARTLESTPAEGGGRTKLYFYWGERDHWVADETRDLLLGTRGRRGGEGNEGRPVMEIDGRGIPHGFCVREGSSAVVAEKVAEWVGEIVEGLGR